TLLHTGEKPVVSRNNLLTTPAWRIGNRTEYALEGSGFTYEAGDALGVMPVNCPDLVSEMLAALGLDGEEAVTISDGTGTALRNALLHHYDISRPSNDLLNAVADRSPDGELRALLDPARREELKKFLWGREVIDLLRGIQPA
ncbi:MAG: sulfite reductase subunit alpha, partial [Verrucomicrobiota bacterium]